MKTRVGVPEWRPYEPLSGPLRNVRDLAVRRISFLLILKVDAFIEDTTFLWVYDDSGHFDLIL